MDLSVIIPAFNEEDYVSQCLSSVKNVLGGVILIMKYYWWTMDLVIKRLK